MQFWKRTCNNIFVFCLFVIYFLGRLLPFNSAFLKGFGVRMGPHNTAYRKAIVQFEIWEVNCVSFFYNQMHFFFREVWKMHQLICTRRKQSDWNSMLVCSFILLFYCAPMTPYNIRFRITLSTISSTEQSTTGLSKYEVRVLQT